MVLESIRLLCRSFIYVNYFGYSAPKSDVDAVNLMKKAWRNIEDRPLEEVSVIDIIDEETMLNTWKDFIHSHHYRYSNSFLILT